jgi:hypothetical protein
MRGTFVLRCRFVNATSWIGRPKNGRDTSSCALADKTAALTIQRV